MFFVVILYQKQTGITSQIWKRVGLFSFKKMSNLASFFENPVRLGMQIAFGRVRRKTAPTGPGAETVILSKIDTYGALLQQLHECFDIRCRSLAGVVFADVCCCGVVNLGFASEKW